MKKILILLFGLALIAGCSNEKNTGPTLGTIEGDWSGISMAIFPGMVDEPLEDSVLIEFTFTESEFSYICTDPDDPGEMAPAATGKYVIHNDSITLYDVLHYEYYSPLFLEGAFSLDLNLTNAEMIQTEQEVYIWPTYHRVTLQRTSKKQ